MRRRSPGSLPLCASPADRTGRDAPLSACPPGWHLSTEYEWLELEAAAGLPVGHLDRRGNRGTDEGARLKAGGDLGFDAQMGGWRNFENGEYRGKDENAALWTANEADLEAARWMPHGVVFEPGT